MKKEKKKKESPGVEGERHHLGERSGERRRSRRDRRRASADGARGAHPKPLVDAIGVEAVVALRNRPDGLVGTVLRQADGARAVVGPRQPPALAQYHLRIRLYCRAI